MAKKIIGIFLFIGSLFVFSQEKASLVYEYSYIKDSLNTQSKKIEYFQLRVLDKFSLFVSEKNIKRDSLSQSLIKNFEQKKSNSFDLTGYPLSDFKFYLLKYFSENKFKIYQKFEKQFYFYTEEELPIWILKSEVVKIGDLNCHKAETFYRGRKWIAWYTTDVPIITGPYKFSNLPGMVVQLENSTGTLSFNLVSYKVGSKNEDVFLPENMISNAKEIKRKEFLILEQSTKENLILKAKNLGMGISAEQEKSYRDKIKKDNNPIELK
jgi:GLPGLI family protein